MSVLSPSQARAQKCDGWLSGPMHAQSLTSSGDIYAATTWTPPGGVPWLIVGGNFTNLGGMPLSNIAAWDGASWRPLSSGMNGTVLALTTHNGELIAGGYFDEAGGVTAHHIARFDGTSWQPLNTGLQLSNFDNAHCRALTVYNNELIATGEFWSAGGVSARNIARWNGSNWAPLGFPGTGLTAIPSLDQANGWSLAVYNGSLYVGGNFAAAGGVNASYIARWDGTNWSALGVGTSSIVTDMTVVNGELAVGGYFAQAGGMTSLSVARWNGSSWATYGSGVFGSCESIINYNGQLIAGISGALDQKLLKVWNGSSWQTFAGGLTGAWVFDMTMYNGNLVAVGRIGTAGSSAVQVADAAIWNGSMWSAMHVKPAVVTAMETFGSRLFIGGAFVQSTTNGVPANNVMVYDGATKSPLQQGVNAVAGFEGAVDSVRALKAFSEGGVFGGDRLVVGGYFTSAGGMPVNRIAMWNEPTLTLPHWSPMGNGFNAGVLALERHNGAIYAGGEFTFSGNTFVNHIAQWNGSAWLPVSGGVNGTVYAMKVFNGDLYIGGDFTTAGGVQTGGLARWNGTSWSAVNVPFTGAVYALEVHNNLLFIGGVFPTIANLTPNILGYNGELYFSLGGGGTNGPVLALKAHGDSLYLGGYFTIAGSISANRVARWNELNGWSAVDAGADGVVYALASFADELHVGGAFNSVGSNPVLARAWARYTDSAPWIVQQPVDVDGQCHSNAVLNVEASATGELTFAWKRNGQLLVDGETPHGSVISGANTESLMISNLHTFDTGGYSCLVSNECGDVESTIATLIVMQCCPADIAPVGGDGQVNVLDLLALINAWGPCFPSDDCDQDIAPFGGDGLVNVLDLMHVLNTWGACP